ncbi:hypothetical protein AAEP93_004177 [Penicillium crustosum]
MGAFHFNRSLLWLFGLTCLFLLCQNAQAAGCSALAPCATGCCNKFGYCGITDDFSGADCVASCDFEPECSASKPCAQGCCNKFGFCGLGPDFCGDDCVANCERKSECDPGKYGDYAESKKCPLNVCCSKFGFCGTTKDFCGTKKVKRPSCPNKDSLNRVVGYYEGWSVNRPCNVFYPDQIPVGVYTHLNYAFASVDPESFAVLAPSESEKKLMKRLTDLKKADPDLKVFIAIGGWTFNDPGPTRTTFMTDYNFDGVDLDWEYPTADDRGGREEDFKNLPKFLANLKKSLKGTGGRDGVSITLPASYWYLQHFDLENLHKHVDFFNIMSYDLHGKWDLGNQWLDPVLNSHTNLTEIKNAMDLIWRNDVPSDKVVLGLAFHARVFSASDPACMDPGCPFVSGGNPGPCSDEVSILLNSEVKDIMSEKKLTSKLDKDAAVKILKFDTNQWLTYDDEETLEMKTDFAKSQCLGGVMIWAVSHDHPSGNFSTALAKKTGRKVTSLAFDKTKDSMEVQKTHLQCRWTNCFESCPSGWTTVARTDKGARGDERMWDNTGCGGDGQHTFCCPPDSEQPKCGWYTHNNGHCKSDCPSGYVEVGSNFQHCSNNDNDYQAACCTTDTNSMKLYSQCDWAGSAPGCDSGECPSNMEYFLNSTTGSGGNYCNAKSVKYTWNGNEGTSWETRKYCCDDDDKTKWDDCEWRDDIGLALADGVVKDYCYSGCPSDKVRVAMDQHRDGCKGDGGKSMCCSANYVTKTKRSYTDSESRLESNVKAFMKNPDCGSDAYNFKRDLESMEFVGLSSGEYNHTSVLHRRFDTRPYESMRGLMLDIGFTLVAGQAAIEIWDKNVASVYKNFAVDKIQSWLKKNPEWKEDGMVDYSALIVCNMDIFDDKIGGEDSEISCEYAYRSCCPDGQEDCSDEDSDDDDDGGNLEARSLEKRAGPRPSRVPFRNGGSLNWESFSYRSSGEWAVGHPIWNHAYEYRGEAECLDTTLGSQRITTARGRRPYSAEYYIELNTIQGFLRNGYAGRLSTGGQPRNSALPRPFLEALNTPMLRVAPPMAGGEASSTPLVRVMNALGSRSNEQNFMVLLQGLNLIKSRMWRDATRYANMTTQMELDNPNEALQSIRSVITVMNYLNDPRVRPRMVATSNEIRREWGLVDQQWTADGNDAVYAQDWWDQWFRDRLQHIGTTNTNWALSSIADMRRLWAVRTGSNVAPTIETLDKMKADATDMKIDMDDLD